MTARSTADLDAAHMPEIGDVYVHRNGVFVRHWRVTGLMTHGTRRYAVLCDIEDPVRSAIVSVADFGSGGPFVRMSRQ
jgi:hypothetical protein